MPIKATQLLFMTSVFLLTSFANAKDPHFIQAQKFISESRIEEKKNPSAKNQTSLLQRQPQNQNNFKNKNASSYNLATPPVKKGQAIYISLMNEKWNRSSAAGSPDFRTSLGLTIPILTQAGKTKGEFSISGDIRDASEWGRIRFMHRETVNLMRWNDTQLELFAGAGLGYGYGDLIDSKNRVFAPWVAGFFFNQIHKQQPVFYRFEVGFTGDMNFSGAEHNAGFFGNISLGYKL